MRLSVNNIIVHLNNAMEQLDDCVSLFGLPTHAGVAVCRSAALARMATAEQAAGLAVCPADHPLVRASRIEAKALGLDRIYRERRLVMGFNAQAEAIQSRIIGILDDGSQAGRAWARFMSAQLGLTERLEREPRQAAGDAFVVYADGDVPFLSAELSECVTAPEAEMAA